VLDEVQRLAQQSLIVVGVGPAEPVSQPLDLDPFRSADPIRDELAKINPDELSPREALELLYRLKKI